MSHWKESVAMDKKKKNTPTSLLSMFRT